MTGKPITGYTRIISCKPPRAVKSYSLVMREFAAGQKVDPEFPEIDRFFNSGLLSV